MASLSLTEYQENFTLMSTLWNPLTADYIIKNLIPLKEKFVALYINKHPHFGITVTSRVEVSHSYIKRFINSSTGSFYAIVKQIHQALTSSLHERYIESSQHLYKHLIGLPPCLATLNVHIKHFSLKSLHSLYISKPNTSNCKISYPKLSNSPG